LLPLLLLTRRQHEGQRGKEPCLTNAFLITIFTSLGYTRCSGESAPEANMRQLVYVSAASRELDDRDLEQILDASRRNNPKHDVTGMLLAITLDFYRFWKGPAKASNMSLHESRRTRATNP